MIEICSADFDSVLAASAGGADRVELCSGLSEGGLTPSAGLIRKALTVENLRVHILIRPRRGDFLYTPSEVEIMEQDILEAKRLGAHGVVIGALLPDGNIDCATTARLCQAAHPMYVTFHRAFDVCCNPSEALEQLITLGCNGLLTSGQAPTALQGAETLAKLNAQAAGRIDIIAACGINSSNTAEILRTTGVRDIHASASHTVVSAMTYRNPSVSMGGNEDEYLRRTSSVDEIKSIRKAYESL